MQKSTLETEKEITEGYRLSPQQRHLWLLQKADNSQQYLTRCAVAIQGHLDPETLLFALEQIVSKHEILRTNFDCLPGMTVGVQIIADRRFQKNKIEDFSNLNWTEKTSYFDKIWKEFCLQEFDLERDSPFQVSLVKLGSDRHILLINLPAICADSTTLQILIGDISKEYDACLSGENLPEPELQYADIAEWQNELLEGEDAQLGKEYWQQQDFSNRFNLKLPFEAEAEEFQPRVKKLIIRESCLEQIEKTNSSISEFFLTCWLTLIWRLTGETNLVIGLVGDGRKYEELDRALGLFAKHLPLCFQLEEDWKFENLLERVKLSGAEVLKWQDYFTWDELTGDYSQECFLPLAFEFLELNKNSGSLDFAIDKIYSCTDKYRVKLVVTRGSNLTAEFHYDANVYDGEDMERLAEQFETLLTSALANPGSEISKLKITSDRQNQKLLIDFNNTQKTFPLDKCIHHLFEEQAQTNPDNIAAVCEDKKISYGELNAKSNRLARYLQKQGVKPEVPVGIYCDRSLELIIGILGILKAGGAYLPLDAKLPSESLKFRLEDAKAPVVLTQQHLLDKLPPSEAKTICLDGDWEEIAGENTDNPTNKVTPENLVYLTYTSGSTGKPKGVAVEHQQLLNYLYAIKEQLQISPGASFAIVSTFAADLGNTVVFPSLCFGGTLHVISEERAFDAEGLIDYFDRHPIDYLKIVPSHLGSLLSASKPEKILPRQKLIIGGEALSWQLVKRIQKYAPNCQILNHYGPTETTVGIATFKLGNSQFSSYSKTTPLGRPVANTQIYILDRHLEPVPIGVAGELQVGGANVTRGYLDRPQLTAEKFIPNPFGREDRQYLYKTGDLARYLPDGNIEFLGRGDRQVKIHGFRVELEEIESVLKNHPAVENAVVTLREDESEKPSEPLGEKPSGPKSERPRLVAYVVLDRDLESARQQLRGFLAEKLPEPVIPQAFVVLKSIPLTPNGKIDRQALPAPEKAIAQNAFVAPNTAVEKQLADIWAEVLKVEKVGIEDNFFELGGDSILSIQVIARANQVGLNIAPRQMFDRQTIAELAAVVDTLPAAIAEQNIITGQVPLIPIQHWFFQQNLPEAHHWNQSVFLEVSPEINPALLEETLGHLLRHHDGLRLRFLLDGEEWQQFNAEPNNEEIPFVRVEVASISELEAAATQLQASLNLSEGPLMRVGLFELGEARPGYLAIAIHHLAVDGISWRILLEDFQTVYRQLSQGTKVALPPKTTSFKHWAEKLNNYAKSAELKSQLNYWITELTQPVTPLPVDYPDGKNTVAVSATISVALDAAETQALLQEVPAAYQTQIDDVLLAALALAWEGQTVGRSLSVDLESHGREDIFPDVNLSRTVGWFTSIYPVRLNWAEKADLDDALKTIKEQLRKIPNRGIGYGLLRYLSEEEIVSKIQNWPRGEIRFNYLGQLDNILPESSLFKLAFESKGIERSLKGDRAYLIDINGFVSGGKLQLNWTYSSEKFRRTTVEKLAENYLEKLRGIIDRCLEPEAGGYTPSDFPQANLDNEELDILMGKLTGI